MAQEKFLTHLRRLVQATAQMPKEDFPATHTLVGGMTGIRGPRRLVIAIEEDERQFLSAYAAAVAAGMRATLTEVRRRDFVRVTIDIDRNLPQAPDSIRRPITSQVAERIVDSVTRAVKDTCGGCRESALPRLQLDEWIEQTGDIHAKPAYQKEGGMWRCGLHVVLHNLRLPRTHLHLLQTHLHKQLLWLDEGRAYDRNSPTGPWYLLGSAASTDKTPYTPWMTFRCLPQGGYEWSFSTELKEADILRCSVREPMAQRTVLSAVPHAGKVEPPDQNVILHTT